MLITAMQQKRLSRAIWGLGFLVLLTAPIVIGAESPTLSNLITHGLARDRELQQLALTRAVSRLEENRNDVPNYTPFSLSTGTSGVRIDTNTRNEDEVGRRFSTQISGSPTATWKFGDEGETSVQISTPFSIWPEAGFTNSSSVSPSLILSRTISDVFKYESIDTEAIEKELSALNHLQTQRTRESEVIIEILTAVRTVFEKEQNKLSAEQTLAEEIITRNSLVNIDRRSPTSLLVLQADDRIAAAELDIQDAITLQRTALDDLSRLTGISNLDAQAVLAIDLPSPNQIEISWQPEPLAFTSVTKAELELSITRLATAASVEKNPVTLSLEVGGRSTLNRLNSNPLSTASVWGSTGLKDGDNWSLNLELGYSFSQTQSGPNLAILGTWSPGTSSYGSDQSILAREIQNLNLQKAELSYQSALLDAENTIRGLETELRQVSLSQNSWIRRLAITQAVYHETLASYETGLTTQESVEEARRNLLSQQYQGSIVSLNKFMLIQKMERTTL
jgi:hypothetical protein